MVERHVRALNRISNNLKSGVVSSLTLCTIYIHVGEMKKGGRKKQASNKANQHSTPKAVTFPKKNELPRVHVHVFK